MKTTNAPDRYAVFGNPIEHSKSPLIHQAFAKACKQHIEYTKILAPLGGFAQALDDFFNAGGKGCNVTVPFKEDAWQAAKYLSEGARRAGAVNTLWRDESGVYVGDNTDGKGIIRDLCTNLGLSLAGKQILILGAGGAVRGVLAPLLEQRPASLTIANRTVGKARNLAALPENASVSACAYEALAGQRFDLIINGTSAGLQGQMPALPDNLLNSGATAYDMLYAAQPTVFMEWAQQQGATQIADGLGMLVEQAAESFYLWRGVRPQTAPVIRLLRESM